ncbi:hypothetical protein [Glaciecola sp. SC05]|uniref:hypothetical protein n=1 Tax=Glaciecola sp. SC05 TaxID=1987355 RepID=UPI0035299DFB
MNHLNSMNIAVGAMSNMRVLISCVDYNHDILSVSDFQEQVIEQLLDYYHSRLLCNLATLRKLESIGVSKTIIKKYKIGLCDRTLNHHVDHSRTPEGASVRGVLEVHGLIRPSGHEELRGCLVVPLFDENGLIAGVFAKRLAQYIRRNGRRFTLWLATQNAINTLVFPNIIEVLRHEN